MNLGDHFAHFSLAGVEPAQALIDLLSDHEEFLQVGARAGSAGLPELFDLAPQLFFASASLVKFALERFELFR